MNILTVPDWKMIFKIKISFDLDMEIQGLHMPHDYSAFTWTQTKFSWQPLVYTSMVTFHWKPSEEF
jgi:ribonucleotide reductase beta subunit family protein with ferritin-like domain